MLRRAEGVYSYSGKPGLPLLYMVVAPSNHSSEPFTFDSHTRPNGILRQQPRGRDRHSDKPAAAAGKTPTALLVAASTPYKLSNSLILVLRNQTPGT